MLLKRTAIDKFNQRSRSSKYNLYRSLCRKNPNIPKQIIFDNLFYIYYNDYYRVESYSGELRKVPNNFTVNSEHFIKKYKVRSQDGNFKNPKIFSQPFSLLNLECSYNLPLLEKYVTYLGGHVRALLSQCGYLLSKLVLRYLSDFQIINYRANSQVRSYLSLCIIAVQVQLEKYRGNFVQVMLHYKQHNKIKKIAQDILGVTQHHKHDIHSLMYKIRAARFCNSPSFFGSGFSSKLTRTDLYNNSYLNWVERHAYESERGMCERKCSDCVFFDTTPYPDAVPFKY